MLRPAAHAPEPPRPDRNRSRGIARIGFAVVGCGHIGRRHLRILEAHPQVELVAACDRDPAVRAALELGCPVHEDFEALLRQRPDVLSVCTPHAFHAPMSVRALECGIDVLVEKPMALTVADCRRMIDTAAEHGRRLWVVKQNRYNRPIELVRRALADDRLGRIYLVQCSVLWNRNEAYYRDSPWRGSRALEGGALHTQVSHFLDLLVWWFGEIDDAATRLATLRHEIDFEDTGVSVFRFASGAVGSLAWTTAAYNVNFEGSITIVGEKGTIRIGGQFLNRIDHWDVQSTPMPGDVAFDDAPNDYGTHVGSGSNHGPLIDDLVAQIISDRRGVVEGEEGMRSIEAIEALYGAAAR